MEIKICDKCGKIIENYVESINTSTIGCDDINMCRECSEELLSSLVTKKNGYKERLKDRVLEAKEVVLKKEEVR